MHLIVNIYQEKEKSHEKSIYCDADSVVFNNGVRGCTGGKKREKKQPVKFVSLNTTDELNNLGLRFATGLYSPIIDRVYIIPSGSMRITLPNSSSYGFSSSGIVFDIEFGIGIRL